MADNSLDKENDSKRKRSEQSSVSDLDISVGNNTSKATKKKKKKANIMANEDVARQLKEIYKKVGKCCYER